MSLDFFKRIYQLAIGAGLLLAVFLYTWGFDSYSETDLVRLSYLWLPLIFFGLAGFIFHKRGKQSLWVGLGAAVFFTFWLIFFFELIFPAL